MSNNKANEVKPIIGFFIIDTSDLRAVFSYSIFESIGFD